jgi:hypothetical protein
LARYRPPVARCTRAWPSTHFDPRMNLTLRDMYHLSGDDKTGERVLPLLVAEDPKAGI